MKASAKRRPRLSSRSGSTTGTVLPGSHIAFLNTGNASTVVEPDMSFRHYYTRFRADFVGMDE